MAKINQTADASMLAAMRQESTAQIDRTLSTMTATEARRAIMIFDRLNIVGRGRRGRIGEAFIRSTMKETRLSRSTIYADLRRAEALGVDGLRMVERSSLDRGIELDALVKMPNKATRLRLMKRAQDGEHVSAIDMDKVP